MGTMARKCAHEGCFNDTDHPAYWADSWDYCYHHDAMRRDRCRQSEMLGAAIAGAVVGALAAWSLIAMLGEMVC